MLLQNLNQPQPHSSASMVIPGGRCISGRPAFATFFHERWLGVEGGVRAPEWQAWKPRFSQSQCLMFLGLRCRRGLLCYSNALNSRYRASQPGSSKSHASPPKFLRFAVRGLPLHGMTRAGTRAQRHRGPNVPRPTWKKRTKTSVPRLDTQVP